MNDFNEIIPGLYLGSYDAIYTNEFKQLGITFIISTTPDEETKRHPTIVNCRLAMSSRMNNETLCERIQSASNLIKGLLGDGETIYIHCYEGVSRSAACVIYYIAKTLNLNLEDAITFVKEKRPSVNPNERMLECLDKSFSKL